MNMHAHALEVESTSENPKTGLADDYRKSMAGKLSEILSATYNLTVKSHVYHWNVAGPLFKPVHELTEDHYNNLFAAADELAERVRALGHLAPLDGKLLADMSPNSNIKDVTVTHDMIKDLINDHEKMCITMRQSAETAGDNKDMVTEDLLTERLAFHEQAIWMLRAIIA